MIVFKYFIFDQVKIAGFFSVNQNEVVPSDSDTKMHDDGRRLAFDPTRARYPVCGYRWIDNHFTILDFAFLSQLAYCPANSPLCHTFRLARTRRFLPPFNSTKMVILIFLSVGFGTTSFCRLAMSLK